MSEVHSTEEVWKDIPGYEGLYQASTLGRIKALAASRIGSSRSKKKFNRHYKERLLQIKTTQRGYSEVNLYKNGLCTTIRVNRLILLVFVGPCPPGKQSRHFPDNKRTNNELSNLSWATPKENCADKIHHGTDNRGEKAYNAKLTNEIVLSIRKMWNTGKLNQRQIARLLNIKSHTVWKVVHRKVFSHI